MKARPAVIVSSEIKSKFGSTPIDPMVPTTIAIANANPVVDAVCRLRFMKADAIPYLEGSIEPKIEL